jgi:uncharacterized protein with HEPN domain
MSPAHQLELIDRYPTLFRLANEITLPLEPFARDGFQIGDGWLGIVDRLAAKLAVDPDLVVAQVKEKFGELRVYIEGVAAQSAPYNPALEKQLNVECITVREESRHICEICGEPGRHAQHILGWYATRCEPCAALEILEDRCRWLAARIKKPVTPGLRLATMSLKEFQGREQRSALFRAACKIRLIHMGKAAERQSAERRASLPGVDWQRLDQFRDEAYVLGMAASEVWRFLKNEIFALEKALL